MFCTFYSTFPHDFFMSCYKFFRQTSLLICGFQQIWWVTNVKVILWLLGACCEAPGILQDSSCQSASVQCRTMKKAVLFNHEITWSQEGGVLSHCVVNKRKLHVSTFKLLRKYLGQWYHSPLIRLENGWNRPWSLISSFPNLSSH